MRFNQDVIFYWIVIFSKKSVDAVKAVLDFVILILFVKFKQKWPLNVLYLVFLVWFLPENSLNDKNKQLSG